MKFSNQRCQTHKQKCLGIDISPQCDPKSRHCCIDCLKDPKKSQTSISYEQADTYLINMKKFFKLNKETQNKRNLQILQDLTVISKEIQNNFKEILDQINDSIQYQTQTIEEFQSQIDEKLNEIDIEIFLSSTHEFASHTLNHRGFQKQLKFRCDQITHNEVINKFHEKYLKWDETSILLVPQFPVQQKQNIKKKIKTFFWLFFT